MTCIPPKKPPFLAAHKGLMSGNTIPDTIPHAKQKSLAAFTLIELSIVLVIIGLVLGGLLAGKDLYDMAQARSLISQMNEYQAAITTFKLKYHCVPGDCANATAFGIGLNGNDDSGVGSTVFASASSHGCISDGANVCMTFNPTLNLDWVKHAAIQGEQQYFWVHLANAGLIKGNYASLALDNTGVLATDMPQYFPKDALGKAYLTAFTWGGRLFVRTGMGYLAAWKQGQMDTMVLSASQMNSLFSKYYTRIVIGTTTYDSLFASGQKVMPLGTSVNPAHIYYMKDASTTAPGTPACAVSNGAGGYKFNIVGKGVCNLLWEFAY